MIFGWTIPLSYKKQKQSWALSSKRLYGTHMHTRFIHDLNESFFLFHTHTNTNTRLSSMAPDLVNDSICGQLRTVVWLWLHLSNKATWTRGHPFKSRPLSCEELFFFLLSQSEHFLPQLFWLLFIFKKEWLECGRSHQRSTSALTFPIVITGWDVHPPLTADQHTHLNF